MDPFTIIGGLTMLGSMIGGASEQKPVWEDVTFEKNLGLNTNEESYRYWDSEASARYSEAMGVTDRMLADLAEGEARDRSAIERKMANRAPGLSALRAMSGSSFGSTAATQNYDRMRAEDADAYTTAIDSMAGRWAQQRTGARVAGEQIKAGYVKDRLAMLQFGKQMATQADWKNREFYASTWNAQKELNAKGKYGADLAQYQSDMSFWNNLGAIGGNMLGRGLTQSFNPYGAKDAGPSSIVSDVQKTLSQGAPNMGKDFFALFGGGQSGVQSGFSMKSLSPALTDDNAWLTGGN